MQPEKGCLGLVCLDFVGSKLETSSECLCFLLIDVSKGIQIRVAMCNLTSSIIAFLAAPPRCKVGFGSVIFKSSLVPAASEFMKLDIRMLFWKPSASDLKLGLPWICG